MHAGRQLGMVVSQRVCGISWKRGPPPTSWPLSKAPGKQSISLLISGEAFVNGEKADVHQPAMNAWEQATEKAYKDSGLFSDVKIGATETDLRAEIHVIDRGEVNQAWRFCPASHSR